MLLSPQEEQSRELFAYAGLVLYWAQCFEMSLEIFLLIHTRLANKSISLSELESYESDIQRKTLGGLLRDVRQRVAFDSSAEIAIGDALEKRNLLVHRFFKERGIEALSLAGRAEMIERLQDFEQSFRVADRVAWSIVEAARKVLGIPDEIIQQELKRLAEIS